MDSRKNNRSVLVVGAALILVVALVLIFVLLQPENDREGIVLPTPQTDVPADPVTQESEQEEFLQITTDNVLDALRSLERPLHYNQTYEVAVGVDDVRAARTVELWVSGSLIHAEVSDGSKVRSVLTDGVTAWLWYDVDPNPISVQLSASVTTEDLLGLPGFDYLSTLETMPVEEADYLMLQEPQAQCIYVCARGGADETNRWWINLENGLLCRADALETSQLVYEVRQTFFALLAEGDASFTGKFALPDGTEPFSAEARMLQP